MLCLRSSVEVNLHSTVMAKYDVCETLSRGGFDVGKRVRGCNTRGSFRWWKEAMLLETIRYDWVWCIFSHGITMVVCIIAQTGHYRVLSSHGKAIRRMVPVMDHLYRL